MWVEGLAPIAAPATRTASEDLFDVPDGLLDPAAAFRSTNIGSIIVPSVDPLPSYAVPRRRLEFAAGRDCAARAMAALDMPVLPVGVATDRSPIWPDGVVGSISHSGIIAAAILARRVSGIRSIGLDIEETLPLGLDLNDHILRDEEQAWLETRPDAEQGFLAKAIFCAKEAAYKCQYPISRCLFDFQALRVTLNLPNRRFEARFEIQAGPFAPGSCLSGRIWIAGGHIAAVSMLY